MARILSIAAALLIGSLIIGGAWLYAQPNQWKVEHQATIKAPAEAIFAQLNSLKNSPNWSAWNKAFLPTLESRHGGPDSGVGATEYWTLDGNSGSTTIMKSVPNERIEYKVVSSDGYFVADGFYALTKTETGTKVQWVYKGDSGDNLILKLYMAGALPEINKGNEWSLNNLKRLMEKAANH
ncbi:MAG: SRPBCC family protein [Gammaproteobacteria bacterium]|nr:SRPBCC family protein [Gammaproteobacteria bacterium]